VRPFEEALATIGWKPQDIDIVIHTHLHNDHCENDSLCSNAEFYVQKAELDFCMNPHPIDHRYYPDVLDGVNLKVIEGDTEIVDGIGVIFTPGHTPGGQSVVIRTSEGKAIITGLCCNSENFPPGGGIIAPGVLLDAIQAYDSMTRIKKEADILIPVHDLAVGKRTKIPS
jgi:glyoxylase-like metal-dependent hydrolase (beta-lactamase superfamily II)